MRRFEDDDGRRWDVVLGRESWGGLHVLFVPAGGDREEPVRQAALDAAGRVEAETALARMDDDDLERLFERSEPKDD